MRTRLLALAFALVSVTGYAGDTTRIGRNIVTIGMTMADARQRAGTPEYSEDITNRLGAKLGERWTFRDGRRSIVVTVSGGKVTRIDEALL